MNSSDPTVAPTTFAQATTVTQSAPGRFDATIHPGWAIAGRTHGGFLIALAARSALAVSPHPQVVSANATFLFAPQSGPVTVEVELLRAGGSLSQLRARVLQKGQICLDAAFITGVIDSGTRPYWSSATLPSPGTAAIAECVRVPSVNPFGPPGPLWEKVDVRLEPQTSGYTDGQAGGAGEIRGVLSLPAGEPFDSVSLLFALDALPPATVDVERSHWVPTLTLTVYIRALPGPGPIRLTQSAGVIENRRVDEVCYAWDTAGHLVAQSTQLAGIRLG